MLKYLLLDFIHQTNVFGVYGFETVQNGLSRPVVLLEELFDFVQR